MEDNLKKKRKRSKYFTGGAVLAALLRLFVGFGILPSPTIKFLARFLIYIVPTLAIALVFSLIIRSILEEDRKMKFSFDYFAITYLTIETVILIGAILAKFLTI